MPFSGAPARADERNELTSAPLALSLRKPWPRASESHVTPRAAEAHAAALDESGAKRHVHVHRADHGAHDHGHGHHDHGHDHA